MAQLYGTTTSGGSNSGGTVFSITTAGKGKVLHYFGGVYNGVPDGSSPYAALVNVNGLLYGTTDSGGSGFGTILGISTNGKEKVLFNFGGSAGYFPESAALIAVKGTLYGTTPDGGAAGGGIVFSISTTGKERVLHNFGSGSDGANSYGALLYENGTLYGTTIKGGAYGKGTVYAIQPVR